MLKNIREREILNIMKSKGGFVTVSELCTALYASESSIRRDLSSLEGKGVVKRTYGGAELVTNFSNVIAFGKRVHHNIDAKKVIAKKASTLISDNSIVFLDQSSTAFYLASELLLKKNITVVTNNIEIVSLLSSSKIKTICSGGQLSRENRSCLVGTDAQSTFNRIYADAVFFSTKSLSADGTISDCDPEEVAVRSSMLANAEKKIFLCDSEKFPSRSPYTQYSIKEVDYFVCENDKAKTFNALSKSIRIL